MTYIKAIAGSLLRLPAIAFMMYYDYSSTSEKSSTVFLFDAMRS